MVPFTTLTFQETVLRPRSTTFNNVGMMQKLVQSKTVAVPRRRLRRSTNIDK